MTGAPSDSPRGDAAAQAGADVGVGCLTVPAGFFGGGMLGVAIRMFVTALPLGI